MRTVALVGPDGSGKSIVARRVAASLPVPARLLYMGVNLEADSVMLPTTRLALALKRRRGGRPDLVGAGLADRRHGVDRHRHPGAAQALRSAARLGGWIAEEWYRQALAWAYQVRGNLVVFDRHFFADYHASDVAPVRGRSVVRRIHGFMLAHLYPRPDLIVCLDAPAEVLHSRKGEGTLEEIERRRVEYRALERHVSRFAVVDATKPVDEVVDEVVAIVTAALAAPHRSPVAAPERTVE
jgi:hypothetical protein